MKRTSALAAMGLIIILAMASCVSTSPRDTRQTGTTAGQAIQTSEAVQAGTPPASEAVAAQGKAEPVLRERIEEYQVPVILKETKTFADGIVDQITENTWSPDYTRILSSLTRKPSLPEPVSRTNYTYSDGILTSRSSFGPDNALQNRSTFDYDAQGRLIRETMADGKGVTQSVSEWAWSEERKTEWRVLDATGRILAKTAYRYENDRLSELQMSDGAGNSTGRGVYQYNDEGQLVGIRYFNAAGTPQDRIEYSLENGRLIHEKSYRADGRLERGLLYNYGPEGQILSKTLTDASGRRRESTSFDYSFRTETRTVFYYE